MALTTPNVTLFAVVQRDATGTPVVTAVQTNPIRIEIDSSASGPAWTLGTPSNGDFDGHLKLAGVDDFIWQTAWLGLDRDGGLPAQPFLDGDTITVQVTPQGLSAETLTIHLVALASLDLVIDQTGTLTDTTVQGIGPMPTALRLSATPHWGAPTWSATGASPPIASLDVTGGTVQADVSGDGDFTLRISDTATPDDPDPVGAKLDGVSMYDVNGVAVVDTGVPQPAIHLAEPSDLTVSVDAPTHVGVTSGNPSSIQIPIVVTSPVAWLAKQDLTISLQLTRRDGTPAATTQLAWDAVAGSWQWSVDPSTFAAPVTVNGIAIAPETPSPVVPTLHGDYALASQVVDEVGLTLDLSVPADYGELTVDVSATDLAGHTAGGPRAVVLEIPTDIVLCLDRSGSMNQNADGTTTKWDALTIAANTFHTLYREITGAIGGSVPLTNREGIAHFHWLGTTDHTTSPVALAAPAGTPLPPAPASGSAGAGEAQGWTPIGSGVLNSRAALLANPSDWRRRVIVLMTDGKENRGTTLGDILADSAIDKPDPSSPAPEDLTVHGLTFGMSADTDEPLIDTFRAAFGGEFKSSATDFSSPTDPEGLILAFADMLVASIPSLNRVTMGPGLAAAGTVVPIEDGVSRAVFALAGEAPMATLEHRPDSGSSWSATSHTAVASGGITYFTIDGPAVGEYRVQGTTVPFLAVVDLRLRATFSVLGPSEAGATLTLRAKITDAGRPVTDADVRVKVSAPGYSEGDVADRWAKVNRAWHHKLRLDERGQPSAIDPKTAYATRAPLTVRGVKTKALDARSKRHDVLATAADFFGLPLHARVEDEAGFALTHVGDGVYEASFDNTSNEGAYGFFFEASGKTLSGNRFARGFSVSRYLEPVADPALTTVEWAEIHPERWQLEIKPVQPSGHAVGPLRDYVARLADRDPVKLEARLDGTYTAQVKADSKRAMPSITLDDGRRAVQLDGTSLGIDARRVRVFLKAVEITTARDRDGRDELRLAAMVAPNREPQRVVKTELPIVRASVGERVEIGVPIFDELVEESASLTVAIAGVEVDFDACLRSIERGEPLARYLRHLRGPAAAFRGRYTPDDEPRDPETLKDWRIWYRIDVL